MYKTLAYIKTIGREERVRRLALMFSVPREIAEKINTDDEGYWSITSKNVCSKLAQTLQEFGATGTVVDAFGGVGGMSAGLAPYVDKITAYEIDETRAEMHRANMQLLGATNVETVHTDFFASDAVGDTVLLDMPWGVDYRRHKLLRLTVGGWFLETLIVELGSRFKCFVAKLPVNYDLDYFMRELSEAVGILTVRKFSQPHSCILIVGSYAGAKN